MSKVKEAMASVGTISNCNTAVSFNGMELAMFRRLNYRDRNSIHQQDIRILQVWSTNPLQGAILWQIDYAMINNCSRGCFTNGLTHCYYEMQPVDEVSALTVLTLCT